MSDTTRIGYLTSLYPAPSHTFIRREVTALRARGLDIATYSVRAVSPPPADPLDAAAQAGTYTLLDQPKTAYFGAHFASLMRRPGRYLSTLRLALRHRVPGVRAFLWSIFHFTEAILLARRLKADGIAHLHNHFANPAATVGLLAAHQLGLPWSLTLHGISETDYPAGVLLADKIGRASFVACVSRFGMAQAMRITPPAEWRKFALVRCGIDPAALPPPRATLGDGTRLVCVGRLSPEKGHDGLLDALAMLRTSGHAPHLTLVGDGPEEARLRAAVAARGLDEAVHFAGRLAEPETLAAIAAADILVLPSFMEGLPVVLMEAMALGVPVVASRVAGIPELVRDGESGLLFDPTDWAALADRIARLSADPDLRARFAAAGRKRIAEEFAIERAVAPLPSLLAGERAR